AELARAKQCTPSQLALAWVLTQGEDIVPIPGTKRVRYLEENAAAAAVTLSAAEREAIDAVFPKGAAAGERYTAGGMAAVNRYGGGSARRARTRPRAAADAPA